MKQVCTLLFSFHLKYMLALLFFSGYSSSSVMAQCQGFDVIITGPTFFAFCPGDPIELVANTFNGTPPISYSWSTGGNAQVETVPGPSIGTFYYVTVTDGNGCSAVGAFNTKPPYFNPLIYVSDPACEFVGQVQITVGGQPGWTYLWSTGETVPSIFVNQTGLYEVTVTYSTVGCTKVLSFEPEFFPLPEAEIIGDSEICPWGSGMLEVVGGDFASFIWSTGDTGPTTEAYGPGLYTVIAYDDNDCPAEAEIELTPFPVIPPVVTAPLFACAGASSTIEVANATGYEGFIWDTGESTPTITGTAGVTYYVTVTDYNGCTETGQAYINEHTVFAPSFQGDTVICGGQDTIELSIQSFYEQYEWTTGADTDTIHVVEAGSYGVTVTNDFGCTSEGVFVVDSAAIPAPEVVPPAASCSGTPVQLELSDSTYTSYNWSTGQSDSIITVSQPGTYGLTVTNAEGCTGETDVEVALNVEPTAAISTSPYACNGAVNLLAQGGTQYLWSNGMTSANIEVTSNANYTVTVTDANGCTATSVEAIDIPTPPQVSINGTAALCESTSGILTATSGFDQYAWSNGQTGEEINVSVPGIYSVIVTDADGCTASEEWDVEALSTPNVTVAGPASICMGTNATLTASGNFNQFQWSTGETANSINVSQNGTYAVTVTDANGCTSIDTHDLEISDNLTPVIINTVQPCEGLAMLDAGTGYSTYLWSNGGTGPSISVSDNGIYTVTVSDGSGCSGEDEAAVDIAVLPTVSIDGPTGACEGVMVTFTADPGFASYQWSNGETTATIPISQTGSYSVIATDANGCTATADQSFVTYPLPDVQINAPSSICTGNEAELALSGNFTHISWSTGETTNSIDASQAGIYNVIVTDANGCTATDEHELQVNDSLTPTVDLTTTCSGTASLDAGTGFTNYLWSDGQTEQHISVNTDGDYVVTVTDATGCSGTATMNVQIPVPPSVSINGLDGACFGETITLTADGSFDNYEWSDGSTGNTLDIAQTGTYSIIVTDANGCTASAAHPVEIYPLPTVDINGPSSTCIDNAVDLLATGDFTQVVWSNGSTDPQIIVSQSGTYSVVVTNANGCTAETSHGLQIADSLTPIIAESSSPCDGTSTLDAGGGYTNYLWSNGQTGQNILVQNNGSYSVTVTDDSGCTGEDLLSVNLPTLPSVQILGPTSICTGSNATYAVSGNYAQIEWSPGETTEQINVSTAGTYSVTVTDMNGCTATDEQTLDIADSLSPTIDVQLEDCNGTSMLDAGTGYQSYLWSNGSTDPNILITSDGTYSVTVSDVAGCTGETSLDIIMPTVPIVGIAGAQAICEGGQTLLVADDNFIQYLWNTGETSQGIMVSAGGVYSVTVSDANGCTASEEFTLTEISSDYTYVPMTACSAADTGMVEVIYENQLGCDSLVVVHTTLAPSQSSTVGLSACDGEYASYNGSEILSGTNEVFVYNASNGCDSTVTVQVGSLPAIDLEIQTIASCEQSMDGEIHISLLGGTSPFQFSLNGNQAQSAAVFDSLSSGEHDLLVVDANGCFMQAKVEIPAFVPPTILTEDVQLNCDDTIALLSPEIIGGNTQSLQFEWPNGSTDPSMETNTPGIYNLLVDDGCNVKEYPIQVGWQRENADRDFFYIPNAFSPNNDGINDEFKAFPGRDFKINSFEFKVFDRWGDLMFGTTDATDGWNGIHKGQQKQPAVYVWYVKADVELCDQQKINFYKEGGVTISR